MALPTFLLALPPSPVMLLSYILLMTIGEAMWQPRFLQWVAQIAPEGKTGSYMGIAQFPWFLTKVLTGFYSGHFLAKYCPLVGPQNTEMMWLIYAGMALVTPVALILAVRWMSKGMQKTA
jgi:dipeptide/tripeptide permease